MSEITREPLAGMLNSGLESLLCAHHAEVAHDKAKILLNPNWDEYFELEKRGVFAAWSLRTAGDLIGYNAFFVYRSQHYRDHIFAVNDVVYVRPRYRGLDGLRLILAAENALKAMSVSKAFYHAKSDAVLGGDDDSLGILDAALAIEEEFGLEIADVSKIEAGTLGGVLAALGYSHVEDTFGKLLLEG